MNKERYWLEFSYPSKYWPNLEEEIMNFIDNTDGYDAGMGFGFRDIQIPYDTQEEVEKALENIIDFPSFSLLSDIQINRY